MDDVERKAMPVPELFTEFLCTFYLAARCTGDEICISVINRIIDISPVEKNTNIKKLRGFSPRWNYTDQATAACRRS
jgi:hypothetical protein